MLDIFIKFGLVTGLTIVVGIFVVIYFLADPKTEISIWGVRFHKRWRAPKKLIWRRLPKSIPETWISVLRVFKDNDTTRIREPAVFEATAIKANLTELETREVCTSMVKYGVVEQEFGNYVLTAKGVRLANSLD